MGVAVNVGKREQLAGSSECGGSCTNEKERDGFDGEEIKPTTMRKGERTSAGERCLRKAVLYMRRNLRGA